MKTNKKPKKNNSSVKSLGGAYSSHPDIDKYWEADKNEKFPNSGVRLVINPKN